MVPLKCISSFAQRRILNLNVLSHCASLDGHNRPFIEKKKLAGVASWAEGDDCITVKINFRIIL